MRINYSKSAQIFGHTRIKAQVIKMLNSKKTPHAFLMNGKKGIGKSTLAFHFAQCLLSGLEDFEFLHQVWNTGTIKPSLQSLENLSHPDFFYISTTDKAKSVRISVDEIRQLRHFLMLTPAQAKCKVAIIDEADYMNFNAANSLLKVLEEPPIGTYIFLISNSVSKLPATIQSRCYTLRFHTLEQSIVAEAISQYCKSKEEIQEISKLSNGSINHALKIIESGGEEFIEQLKALINTKHFIHEQTKYWGNFVNQDNESWSTLCYLAELLIYKNCKAALQDADHTSYWQQLFFKMQYYCKSAEALYLDKMQILKLIFEKE